MTEVCVRDRNSGVKSILSFTLAVFSFQCFSEHLFFKLPCRRKCILEQRGFTSSSLAGSNASRSTCFSSSSAGSNASSHSSIFSSSSPTQTIASRSTCLLSPPVATINIVLIELKEFMLHTFASIIVFFAATTTASTACRAKFNSCLQK